MAFPTTAVLDTFNRANGPVGANWTTLVGGFLVSANTCVPGGGSQDAASWVPATFGPDVEAYYTLTTLPADGSAFAIGVIRNGTFNGYLSRLTMASGNDTVVIERLDAGAPTVIATSAAFALVAGDRIGYWLHGTTHQCWVFRLGAWSLVHSLTDATYTGAADYRVLLSTVGVTGAVDDLGGGNEVPVGPAAGKPTHYYQQQRTR